MKRVQKPEFSRAVKIRLAELGWQVNDLAGRVPHHRTAVSKVINGKRRTPQVVVAVRKVLGL